MEDDHPILPTTHGYIKGVKRCSIYGDTYFSFEGIPYAQPPLEALRFKAPKPVRGWDMLLDCSQFAAKPLQNNRLTNEIEGSEDCLYLNVYVKQLNSDKPLPVMVYIYGGLFQTGGATRDLLSPDYFMHEDVILVTFNYRLGALGFLSLNDEELQVPGNAGLKDQLEALRWFKGNCINFNGNPNNITLFGNSAGGASVHFQMLSEKTRGLFHKAIIMSGTVYNKWANVERGEYAHRLALLNGYTGNNVEKQVYEFLMQVEGGKLVSQDIRTDEDRLNDILTVFGPTVEPYTSSDCFISSLPQKLLKSTWSSSIPIMIGGTSFEGLSIYARVKDNPKLLELTRETPEVLLPVEVRQGRTAEECRRLGLQILKLHYGDDVATPDVFKYLDIFSYKHFWDGFHRSIMSRIRYASAPTYLYRFDYDSPIFNLYRLKYCGEGVRGVAHADELSYFFYGTRAWKLPTNSDEYRTIRRMVGMWCAFARNSNPNSEQIARALWLPVSQEHPTRCLNISNNIELLPRLPESDKLEFWNSLHTSEKLY